MFKKYTALLMLILLVPAAGCVATGADKRQDEILNQLQRDVRDLKEVLQLREMETDRLLGQTRGTLPELNLRVDRLQAELQKVVDAIEIAEQRGGVSGGTLTLKNQLDHIRARLDRTEAKLRLPPLDIKVIEEANRAEQELRDRIREPGDETQPEGPEAGDQSAFNAAKESFKAKAYDEALQKFHAFLNTYPDSQYIASAKFYIGESLYSQKKYEEAILEYQKVVTEHKKSSKVPTALLKQGLAFLNIGDKTSGKLLLQKVVREHPKSYAAGVAKKKLRTIK